eukprot:jgi/Botrbrau1/7167/Bobra.0300s0003.1
MPPPPPPVLTNPLGADCQTSGAARGACATQDFKSSSTPNTFLDKLTQQTYKNIQDNYQNPFQMPAGRRLLARKLRFI